ncbi:MAG: PAS domain S-box protein [Elusimicrobia bacterium]|nr:PAS domain S-box protein [Elusimicrobiota bacterium]
MDKDAVRSEPTTGDLLAGVAAAAQTLLTSTSFDQSIMRAVETVGRALDADRICLFELHPHPRTEELLVSRRYEWRRDPALCEPPPILDISLQGNLPRWHAVLSAGDTLEGLVRDMPAAERAFLEPLGSRSLLVVPILIQERWAGFVCFHDCRRDRSWSSDEKSVLRTMAACLGGTLARRQADGAARASIRKYRSLFETSRDGIVIADMEGRIEDANRAFLEMTGYGFDELRGLTYQRLTPLRWAKLDGEMMTEQVLKKGFCEEYEKEYTRRDGAVVPVTVRIWLVRDEQGRPSRMWRITRDITERKKMEESLRASESRLRTMVDKLPVGVWLTDANGRIVLCNQAGEGIWGGVRFSGIEQYGQYPGWWHGTGRRIQPHEWAPVRALSRGETYVNEVIDIETSDGKRKTVSHSAIPVRDDDNRITGIVVINEDITERKRAEARLRESEERHRRITKALSDYVYTVHVQDGRAVSTEHGAACAAVTGYSRDDFASNPYLWLRMVVEADKAAVLEQGRRLLAGQTPAPFEHRIVRKDGQTRWVRNTAVPHCDDQGRLLYYDGVIQDVTDRKEAEDALRLTQFAMDHCAIPVFWIGPTGRFLYVNEAAAQSLGAPREQLLYLGAPDVNPDLPLERWPAHWKELKERKVLHWEGRHRRHDGQVFPVEITANYLEFNGREYDFAFVRDISEQRRAQEAWRESQAKYRIVADNTHDWEFWFAPTGEFLYVSPSCQRVTGRVPEEFIADPGLIFSIIHPEDRPLFESHRHEAVEHQAPGELEFRIVLPDGGVRWIGHVCQPVFDGEGRFLGTRGSNRDITARKAAEESSRFSRFALDNCSIPVHLVDAQGRFQYVNEAACRALGYSREELLALSVWDVDAGLKARAWAAFWKDLRERRGLVFETRERAKDGRLFPAEVSCSFLEHEGRELSFAFVVDITERKRSEEAQGS